MGSEVIVMDSPTFRELTKMIADLATKTEVLADQAKRANRDQWLTLEEAAAHTKLAPRTISKYQHQIGRSQPTGSKDLRFKLGDLEDWFYNSYIKQV